MAAHYSTLLIGGRGTTGSGLRTYLPRLDARYRIVSLDPYGHVVAEVFADLIAEGLDVRPTIAVTRARINLPEIGRAHV